MKLNSLDIQTEELFILNGKIHGMFSNIILFHNWKNPKLSYLLWESERPRI